jgi:3-(3-hydroxy-phenyl)propionate hydroxylase
MEKLDESGAARDVGSDPDVDVLVIGYGPVGRMLALKLGLHGHRVLVVERQAETYLLPRAAHIDDEACRILQSVGASPARMRDAIEPYDDVYEWRSGDRETILRLDWRGRGPSGWQVANFFNQPLLEKHLSDLVTENPNVDVEFGATATAMVEHAGHVDVSVAHEDRSRVVSARYVVGADGARSAVRNWIGEDATDLGYFHDWLVVDLVMKTDEIVFDPPAWQLCDPERPTTLVPSGPGRRRFEFMKLPSETAAELNRESTAWRLLDAWGIGPEQAILERHSLYTFQARWQNNWSAGRVFIVGDAAHLMPPFAGQGMCSGLRDALNLEWKLDLVLRGLAPEPLLDTYETERKEHVRAFIDSSMNLGEVICVTDPEAAAARDRELRGSLLAGAEPPARPLPRLGSGFFDETREGGVLSIQPVVDGGSGEMLLDDVLGTAGSLLTLGSLDAVSERVREQLSARGVECRAITESAGEFALADPRGEIRAWLDEHDARAVIVRPDFYVFGFARDDEELRSLAARFVGGQ